MSREKNPLGLQIPSFLLNFPFTLTTEERNNAWMEDASDEELELDLEAAYMQWLNLYNILAAESLVYLLPSEGDYQDQTYVTNLGLVLPHLPDREMVLLAQFRARGRGGEEKIGERFFNSMGYDTIQAPYDWEGEGETKYLRDNIYFGGYGIRSDARVYEWMRKDFEMEIIDLRETDEYLYHLDTTLFPLSHDTIMLCTEIFTDDEVKAVENVAKIVEVDLDACYYGICNSLRLGDMLLCSSDITSMKASDKHYDYEKHKVNQLDTICAKQGLELVLINMSEYLKSGAMLSCLVMHLNYNDPMFEVL